MSPSPVGMLSVLLLAASASVGPAGASTFTFTATPGAEEALRRNASSVRVGSVDVPAGRGGDPRIGAVCRVPAFCPLGTTLPGWGRTALQVAVAVLLAAEHLNRADESVVPRVGEVRSCGVKFAADVLDNGYDRNYGAVELAQSALGTACAALTVADRDSVPVAMLSGARGVTHVSPFSGSDQLSNTDLYPTFARTMPSDLDRMNAFVKYLCGIGTRHLVLLYEQTPTKVGRATSIMNSASAVCPDIKILPVAVAEEEDDADLSEALVEDRNIHDALRKIKDSGYRHIYSILLWPSLVKVLEAGVDYGLTDNPDYFWAGRMTSQFKPVERGSRIHRAMPGLATIQPLAGVPGGSQEEDSPHSRFDEAFAGLASDPSDVVYLTARMNNTDETTLLPLLEKPINYIPYMAYDAVISLGLAACAADKQDGTYFDGGDLYDALVGTTFNGTTGHVAFTRDGNRDPDSSLFEIVNWRADGDGGDSDGLVPMKMVATHVYRNGEWTQLAPYVYNGGGTSPPADSPRTEVEMHYVGRGLRGAALALCAAVLATSAGWAAWTKKFEKTQVVRASQPIFLGIICGGTMLMGAAIIPMSIDDEIASEKGCSVACMTTPYLLCVGFTLVFSALFAKLQRVHMIFNNPPMKRIKVEALDVMKPLFVLLFVNVLTLALWTGLSPLSWVREATQYDDFGNVSESFGRCASEEGSVLPYVAVLAAANLGAMCFALYQAWLCRTISLEFAESQYIASAIGCFLLVSFVGIPVLVIAGDDPRTQFFVLSSLVFVVCMSLLLFVFVPKDRYRRAKRSVKDGVKKTALAIPNNYSPAAEGRTEDVVPGNGGQSISNAASDEGLRILNHPKTMKQLEEEISSLMQQNRELNQKLINLTQATPGCLGTAPNEQSNKDQTGYN